MVIGSRFNIKKAVDEKYQRKKVVGMKGHFKDIDFELSEDTVEYE